VGSTGAARKASAGIFTEDGSMSGSMDWISSSIGRETGVLMTGEAVGGCTGNETVGIWAIGEPQRLQKTDAAGTLLPHFEQNMLALREDTSC
jgi:hypothetical protein